MPRPFPAYSGGVNDATLSGVSVLVAGAGLAGLSAARDLIARGATVTVVDVRDRVGGRVWTIRDGFAEGQHAEAGGDMHRRGAARDPPACRRVSGSKLTRILKGGFGYVRADQSRPREIVTRNATRGWDRLGGGTARGQPALRASPSSGGTLRSPPISRGGPCRRGSIRSTPTPTCAPPPPALRGSFSPTPKSCRCIALVDQFARERRAGARRILSHRGRQRPPRARARARRSAIACISTPTSSPLSHRGRVVRASVKNDRGAGANQLRLRDSRAAGHVAAPDSDHAGAAGAAARSDRRA